jgi:aminoglycoside 6'-N-acetyltransferase
VLSEWLSSPHVKVWWREESDLDSIEERYGPVVDGMDPTEVFIVERGGQSIGLTQRYKFDDNPAWQSALSVAGTPQNAAGIDYLIGVEQLTGIGLGPKVINRFVRETWTRYPDIAAVVVNISADNRRSWRALEQAAFRRAWSGALVSDDPSDEGVNYVYVRDRPTL